MDNNLSNAEEELAEHRKLDQLLELLKTNHGNVDADEEFEYQSSSSSSSSSDESENDFTIDVSQPQSTEDTAKLSSTISRISFDRNNIEDDTPEIPIDYSNLTELLPSLSYSDFSIISECKDENLKQVLVLNRGKSVHLKRLLKKYTHLLEECHKSLRNWYDQKKDGHKALVAMKSTQKIGYPYFNVDKFGPPNNSDYDRKRANGEINTAYFSKGFLWVPSQIANFKSKLMLNYFMNVVKKLEKEQADYQALVVEDKKYKECLLSKKEEIKEWKLKFLDNEPPDLGDDQYINWNAVCDEVFDDRNMVITCRAFWNLYLHPKINKDDFTEEENERLKELAEKCFYQDWHTINIELNTNRTEFLICQHFQTKLYVPSIDLPYDAAAVHEQIDNIHGPIPWTTISSLSGKRKVVVYHRYRHYNNMKNKKYGSFSVQEDTAIAWLVNKYGEDFDTIAKLMPYRSKFQLTNRYEQYIKIKKMKISGFTVEEDRLIVEHVDKHGREQWASLTERIGRNASHIRHRYDTIQKYVKKNPDVTLEQIPRRNVRRDYVQTMKRLESIKNLDFDEIDDTELLHVEPFIGPRYKSKAEIEQGLINFFKPTASLKKAKSLRQVRADQLDSCARNVSGVLEMLNATLKIPKDLAVTKNSILDTIDIEIIMRLKENTTEEDENHIFKTEKSKDTIMTPNVSSLQTFRWLFVQAFTTKSLIRHSFDDMRNNPCVEMLSRRFNVLFKWPSLMSIVNPTKLRAIRDARRVEEKKRGRPRKDEMKLKMSKVRKSKAHQPVAKLIIQYKNNEQANTTQPQKESPLKPLQNYEIAEAPSTSIEDVKSFIGNKKAANSANAAKVLIKVDKATIENLKKQNLLKGAPKLLPSLSSCTVAHPQTSSSTKTSNINTKTSNINTKTSNSCTKSSDSSTKTSDSSPKKSTRSQENPDGKLKSKSKVDVLQDCTIMTRKRTRSSNASNLGMTNDASDKKKVRCYGKKGS